jgi:DNA replication licensing factor MCM2
MKYGFPVFQTLIEANNVIKFGDEQVVELTDEDKKKIKEYSRKPNI